MIELAHSEVDKENPQADPYHIELIRFIPQALIKIHANDCRGDINDFKEPRGVKKLFDLGSTYVDMLEKMGYMKLHPDRQVSEITQCSNYLGLQKSDKIIRKSIIQFKKSEDPRLLRHIVYLKIHIGFRM